MKTDNRTDGGYQPNEPLKTNPPSAMQEYVPFGDEWKAELKKTPKDFLIQLLRTTLILNQTLTEELHKKNNGDK